MTTSPERDRARRDRDDREDRAQVHRVTAARVQAHVAWVRNGVKRIVWDELEPEDASFLLQDLNAQIAEMALADDFCAVPANTHVMRVCAQLGVLERADDDADDGGGADDDDEPSGSAFPVESRSEHQARVEEEDADPGQAVRRSAA